MFTGLVEAVGVVESLECAGEASRLGLRIPFADELALGDSVAVNGCCLTVADVFPGGAHFDLLAQTLRMTSLGRLVRGSKVNLERALRVGDRLGGHFVQGHVDATGTITHLVEHGQDHVLGLFLPVEIRRLCVPQGSLAVDGISLTIAGLKDDFSAEFWITPHTWVHTHLHAANVGDRLNLEADMLAKHVEHLLALRKP